MQETSVTSQQPKLAAAMIPNHPIPATAGIIACAGGLGTIILPAVTGFVAEARGLRLGFVVLALGGVVLFLMLLSGSRKALETP